MGKLFKKDEQGTGAGIGFRALCCVLAVSHLLHHDNCYLPTLLVPNGLETSCCICRCHWRLCDDGGLSRDGPPGEALGVSSFGKVEVTNTCCRERLLQGAHAPTLPRFLGFVELIHIRRALMNNLRDVQALNNVLQALNKYGESAKEQAQKVMIDLLMKNLEFTREHARLYASTVLSRKRGVLCGLDDYQCNQGKREMAFWHAVWDSRRLANYQAGDLGIYV